MVLTVSRFFLEISWSHSKLFYSDVYMGTRAGTSNRDGPKTPESEICSVNLDFTDHSRDFGFFVSLTFVTFCKTFVYLFVTSCSAVASTQFVGPAMSVQQIDGALFYLNGTFYRCITKPLMFTFTGALYWNSAFKAQATQHSVKNNNKTKIWKNLKNSDKRATSNFQLRKKSWNSNFWLTLHLYTRSMVL